MKIKLFIIWLGFTAIFCLLGCFNPSDPAINLDTALDQASHSDQLVLVDFYATWCGPCKTFKEDKESEPIINQALEPVVFISLDAEAEENLDVAEKYKISAFPTFVLMNASGEIVDTWAGYGEPDDFAKTVKEALADPSTLEQKQARLDEDPDVELALKLASIYELREELARAKVCIVKARASQATPQPELEVRYLSLLSMDKDAFDLAAFRAQADTVFAMDNLEDSKRLQAAWAIEKTARKQDEPELRIPYLDLALDGISESFEAEGADEYYLNNLKISRALHVDQKPELAVQIKRDSMKEGWEETADGLNQFAWWCFENDVNLEEAYDLAVRGVELAEDDETRGMILDTVAEICNARGDCEGAIEWIEKAIAANPDNEYYVEQKEKFQALLDSRAVM